MDLEESMNRAILGKDERQSHIGASVRTAPASHEPLFRLHFPPHKSLLKHDVPFNILLMARDRDNFGRRAASQGILKLCSLSLLFKRASIILPLPTYS